MSPAPAASLDPVHLLLRTTFGLTPALVEEVSRLGPAGWLDQQLSPETIDDTACDRVVARLPLLDRTAAQLRAELRPFGSYDAMEQLVTATVTRACWSRRQLLEVMVELWSNHFNVTCPSSEVWDVRSIDDREVYRRHALGRFSDLLVASAKSPGMLLFLDAASSTAASPNENYGRELLELHTVGVGAGYSETEVRHSAFALTGFTVGEDRRFAYRAQNHVVGPLSVLGWSSANSSSDGQAVAEDYLRYLADHPSTARRLASKLAVRFVSDSPPAGLVDRLAAAYLAADTAIVPVLRVLFASPEFAASAGQKTRRPFEELTGVVRGCGIEPPKSGVEGIRGLRWLAGERGQAPLGWHPPDGYPDVAAAWQGAGTTVQIWRDQLSLAAGWWPDDLQHQGAESLLPTPRPATCGALVDALADRLLHRPLPADERAALVTFLGGDERAVPSDEAVGWQLAALVSLVLATPTWSQR